MNRKRQIAFTAWTTFSLLLVCFAVGCESDPVPQGAAVSCTVEDTAEGAVIRCSDGNEAFVSNGDNGRNGSDGTGGTAGDFNDGSRLTLIKYAGSDGSQYTSIQFYDSVLDASCNVMTHVDGSLRCIPIGYQATASSSYFTDANCTSQLGIDTYASTFSEPPHYIIESAPGAQTDRSSPLSPYRYRVFEVAGAYTGPVYSDLTGSCSQMTIAAVVPYLVGPEVPSSVFVEFTVL